MQVAQVVQVRWGSQLSNSFAVSNGVKQGGILSPVLFSIYTDTMLCALRDTGVGCYLGHLFAGALAYADDVVLLAPTKSALSRMLSVAGDCADMLSLRFNGTKSQYVRFCSGHRASEGDSIDFCGVKVPLSEEGLHLGNLLGVGSRENAIRKAVLDLQCRSNVLLSRFSFCFPDVRYKLFKAYCVIAYGSQLWDFDSRSVNDYFACWRRCVRRVWGLPNMTHCRFLPAICLDRDIKSQLLSRSLNFVRTAASSKNSLLNSCCAVALRGSASAVSNTICRLANDFCLTREWIGFSSEPLPCDTTHVTSPEAAVIRDFAIAHHAASGEDKNFMHEIIYQLCTIRIY